MFPSAPAKNKPTTARKLKHSVSMPQFTVGSEAVEAETGISAKKQRR